MKTLVSTYYYPSISVKSTVVPLQKESKTSFILYYTRYENLATCLSWWLEDGYACIIMSLPRQFMDGWNL